MRLLFICLDPYPTSGACSNLLNKLFNEGHIKDNNNVHVLTRYNTIDEKKESNHYNIFIHKVYTWSLMTKYEISRGIKHCNFTFFKGAILKTIDKIFFKIDRSLFYSINDSKILLNEIEDLNSKYHFDAIIAVAGYFSTADALLNFQTYKGKKLLYMVDPCSTNETFDKKTLQVRKDFEKKIIHNFDYIITTPLIVEEYENRDDLDKTKIIPLEFPNVSPNVSKISKKNSEIKIMFIGRLYAGRNPKFLFNLISSLNRNDIHLYFIGTDESQINYDNSKLVVKCVGNLPLSKIGSYYDDADFFVNIGNEMTNQVPSKLFDYISHGKPIINLCRNQNCPTINYLSKYPAALSLIENHESFNNQVNRLDKFISDYRGFTVDEKILKRLYYTSTPEYCAEVIMKCLNSE